VSSNILQESPLNERTPTIAASVTLTSKLHIGREYMNLQEVVDQLRAERNRLDQAISALEGPSAPRRGRPPKSSTTTGSGRRVMSAAARKRISEAMKARWAARKKRKSPAKTTKATAKKAAGRPQMSPAARKKLSALMKARWAARKKQAGTA
jgi:hypothetical protein